MVLSNNKIFKELVGKKSSSKLLKGFLLISFSAMFLVLSPIIILSLPFVLAWQLTNALTEQPRKVRSFDPFQSKMNKSKWNSFVVDLQGWQDMEDEQ